MKKEERKEIIGDFNERYEAAIAEARSYGFSNEQATYLVGVLLDKIESI